ncbi:MAG TPA: replication initiator [Dermatophilaceae bacterium]|nr:replication initiator [Dermatophilaceae bacterium]
MTRAKVSEVWDAVVDAGALKAGWAGLPGTDAGTHAQVMARLQSADLDDWASTAARVGFCSNPVRLVGHSDIVHRTSGEVVRTYASAEEPLGVTFVRCGNRRADRCPSCSRLYAADTFQLIRAGVAGGKGVPDAVADNPLVFATLTAPSFGAVHGRRHHRRCRPRGGPAALCRHGRPTACFQVHQPDDPALGQPLCPDCYDYESHVVWQWWAPELWRRFTIALKRRLAQLLGADLDRLGDVASLQYAKVAEYQVRGAVHFHALIRLDGPPDADGFGTAPVGITASVLAAVVKEVAGEVTLVADPVTPVGATRVLAFGAQVDTRVVRASRRPDDPDAPLTGEQVAGYLAKYATKSATDTEARDNPHLRRLHVTARHLAAQADAAGDPTSPYRLLGRWAHTLGFRGHVSTKSRRYSVTLGRLRRARQRARIRIAEAARAGTTVDLRELEAELLADDTDEATLVIGSWAYAGSGWANAGETALATAAAARAREYARRRACARRTTHNEVSSDTGKGGRAMTTIEMDQLDRRELER